jgi:hypothetical protein
VSAREDRCFRIPISGGPEAAGIFGKWERWCYRDHWSPVGSTFAYNADSEEAKPELAFIVETDRTLTHGSIVGGRFSVHKLKAIGFSPFSVPVEEPHPSLEEENPFARDERFLKSVERAEQLLASAHQPVASLTIKPGVFEGAVSPSSLPFRGYLWKTRDLPLGPAMQKLDAFARARGHKSNAFVWERDNHKYRGLSWSGHCNGWAASAVLREEPKKTRYDRLSGVTFSISDQKGLMAERDYCVSYSFYGRRFPNGILEDIDPGKFHQVVTYNIGILKRPVAADLLRTRPVMNNVFGAYKTTIRQTGPNAYDVITEIKDYYYDTSINELVGTAPSRQITYRYTLATDSSGNVKSGKWINTNPDFLWVPLSGARCSDENPYVTNAMIDAIEDLQSPSLETN